MPDPVRVAVIGTGNIANQHLPVLRHLPEAQVVALCDTNPEMLRAAEATYQVGRTFDSVDGLMAWGAYDAVFVLVSVLQVARVAERFIRHKTPTFLEKPPGLYSTDTAALARAVEATGTPTQVGFNRRFYTSILAGRAALLETGPIRSVTVHADEDIERIWTNARFTDEVRRRWAYANGIHALDLLRFFGGDVRRVESHFARVRNPMPDAFTAWLEFESGAHGRAHMDHFAPGGGHRYQVRTAEAMLTSYEGFARAVLERRGHESVEFRLTGDDQHLKPGFPGQARAFLELVRTGGQPAFPAASIWDALSTMQMIDAIVQPEAWSGA
ncbi:MAG: Gfo/Idh/MocA family oxidoreductase [Actinobacteria bacterium]|nr:Gfo/Idh/MocA family oxidoreductase [Actinomycetota bacterium]